MMPNWKCMVQKQINIAENVYKAIWQSKFYFYIWEFEFFLTLLYKKMYQHVHICTLQLTFKYQFNWIYKILKYQKCKCTFKFNMILLYEHVLRNSLTLDPYYIWKDTHFGAWFHPNHTLGFTYTINNK